MKTMNLFLNERAEGEIEEQKRVLMAQAQKLREIAKFMCNGSERRRILARAVTAETAAMHLGEIPAY